MLVLLFLFALFRHLQGAPLTANEGDVTELLPTLHVLPRVAIVFGTRTTSDIVTSCLATIFACTWTAIHPNIPSPADSRWDIFKRRIVTTIYALLAPEFITIWAYRQYVGAKDIMKEYNSEIAKRAKHQHRHGPRRSRFQKYWIGFKQWLFHAPTFYPTREGESQPWTTTHGFFVQMGGFVLSKNGTPIQATSFSKYWVENDSDMSEYIKRHKDQPSPCNGIKESILAGVIDAPKITEAEIEDRSKGDIISKTVVILQTTWFIAQCIARWSISIPVTELEIVTLGFAMLNAITYALWWHKPQNVGVQVYLEIKTPLTHSLDNEPRASSNSETKLGIDLPQINTETASSSQIREESDYLVPKNLTDAKLHKPSHLVRKLTEDWSFSPGIQLLFSIPYRLILGVLRPLNKLTEASSDYIREGDLRVPMFFAEPTRNTDSTGYFIGVVAILFGCVHLVPSFFLHYSSPKEMWLWRISAAFITVQPLVTLIAGYIREMKERESSHPDWIDSIVILLVAVSFPLYIVARLALIILAFVSLRGLPDNAHLTIDWIPFIPHL